MQQTIIIVTSAYGSRKIEQLGGQRQLLATIKQAGADGVEIRRELLSDEELTNLPDLAQAIRAHQLVCYYSVPFALFSEGGQLNPQLHDMLAEAKQLKAQVIKFSLGDYRTSRSLTILDEQLQGTSIQLVIENDQTEFGKRALFEQFFKQVKQNGIAVKMTFDTGNWFWVDESAELAAEHLAPYVDYIHVKAVSQTLQGHKVAIPPRGLDDPIIALLKQLPSSATLGIEFPLEGDEMVSVSKRYVQLLKQIR